MLSLCMHSKLFECELFCLLEICDFAWNAHLISEGILIQRPMNTNLFASSRVDDKWTNDMQILHGHLGAWLYISNDPSYPQTMLNPILYSDLIYLHFLVEIFTTILHCVVILFCSFWLIVGDLFVTLQVCIWRFQKAIAGISCLNRRNCSPADIKRGTVHVPCSTWILEESLCLSKAWDCCQVFNSLVFCIINNNTTPRVDPLCCIDRSSGLRMLPPWEEDGLWALKTSYSWWGKIRW